MNLRRTPVILLVAAYAAALFAVGWREWHARPPDRVTIRVSHFQLEGTVRDGFDAVIRRYEQVNPRVHVEQLAVPGTIYTEWMRAQLAGGTAPDVLEYTTSWGHMQELAQRYFQPITREALLPNPYNRGTPLEGIPWRDTFVDGMNGVDGYIPGLGDYYAPGVCMFTLRVFYNRTLMREITGSGEAPRNWREFLRVCAAVREYARTRHLQLFPVASSRANCQYLASPVMLSLGGRLYERLDHRHSLKVNYEEAVTGLLRGEWSYRTPEVADGLEVFREFGVNSQPGFAHASVDMAMLYFLRGEAVMFCSGSWDASTLKRDAAFEVGAFRPPLPGPDDPQFGSVIMGPLSDGCVQTGTPLFLNKASRSQAEAIDFLRFLTSREGNQIFVNESQWLPAVREVRPTDFSGEFKPFYDGYCWENTTSYLFNGTGMDMTGTFLNEMNLMFGPDGSVAAMQDAMERLLPVANDHDLRIFLRDARDAFNGADATFATRHRADPRDTRLLAPPALQEAEYYDILALVDGGARGGDVPHETGVVPPGDSQTASREARFDQAVSLLERQPATAEQVGGARRLLAALAEGGDDDPGLGSRYFLGRIAQYYQDRPDLPEAARQFRLLVNSRPDSLWAQTALTRLAVLQIYGLDPGIIPAVRIAAAGRLLARATNPMAASEIHLVIEDAIFHFRLPPAQALPHLLAAGNIGLLDGPTRADVLVQIAEVSSLLGRTADARTYYGKLLAEFPRDERHYMVGLRLAALK